MQTHKVQEGETITSIAKLFAVDRDLLAELNGIRNINFIRKGQVLKIPPKRERNLPKATHDLPASRPAASTNMHGGWDLGDTVVRATIASMTWLDDLLQALRVQEANERRQTHDSAPLSQDNRPTKHTPQKPENESSRGTRSLSDVKSALRESLGKEPHVVTFAGVKLTANERKQLIAAVATCEMNGNGFGSINADQEFVGRKYGKKGIGGLTYSRIVHIGLSYGCIQFTQDSGSLGKLLGRLKNKNEAKFIQIFGGGDADIAGSLVTLTTTGRPDVRDRSEVPISGQAYWNQIKRKSLGKELFSLANGPTQSDLPVSREIRGKRVQPIPASRGASPSDIWTGPWRSRFLEAGNVTEFQEVQLELAVDDYVLPILPLAKKNKVRSALGLAFVIACSVRGGAHSDLTKLLYMVAEELRITLPFDNSEDERKCVEAIAKAKGKIGAIAIAEDETRRAKLLIQDELGFLAEDLYDLSSY